MLRFILFTVRGVDVRIHPSFFVVALFFVWMLATSFFPEIHPHLNEGTLWGMALAGAAGLTLSVAVHEIFHALAARRAGTELRSITLSLLGGVAEMDEPHTWKDEIFVASAGAVAGLALAGLFHCLALIARVAGADVPVTAVLSYLGWLNLLLVGFNLLPAFPLDGGRIVRALLWRNGHSRAFATELAAGFGKTFAVLFIVIGALSVFFDSILIGLWWVAIGLFLRTAARRATSTIVGHEALRGEHIARFLHPALVCVPPQLSLHAFLHDVVYRHRERTFPVVQDGLFLGTVSARGLRRVGRARLTIWSVAHILIPPSTATCLAENADAADALRAMGRGAVDRLFVIAEGNGGERLLGVVKRDDLLDFVALKLEIDGPATDATFDADVLATDSRVVRSFATSFSRFS